MKKLAILLLCCVWSSAAGRLVKNWSHEELTKLADVVVIAEAVSTKKVDIPAPFASKTLPADNFEAWVTSFKILTTFKGEAPSEKLLEILHFKYSDKVRGIYNGAFFVHFQIGPVERKITTIKDGKKGDERGVSKKSTSWLAYLKRREDGTFEPVTGHYDATLSFMELDEVPSFYH